MDFSNDDVCDHSILFNIDKWGTKREDHPVEGIVTRRSNLTIPIPFMCKGVVGYVKKGGKGWLYVEGHRDSPTCYLLMIALYSAGFRSQNVIG